MFRSPLSSWRSFRPLKKPQASKGFCTPVYDQITYSRVKRALLKDTLATKIFSVIALASGFATTVYYLYKKENDVEGKIQQAIGHLESEDPEIKKDGFELLSHAVHTTIRTFSGPVGLISDPNTFTKPEVVSALWKNVSPENPIAEEAIRWLIRFTDHHLPTSQQARDLIRERDPDLSAFGALLSSNNYQKDNLWLAASRLLLNFTKEDVAKLSSLDSLSKGITDLVESRDPAAACVALELYSLVPEVTLQPEVKSTLDQLTEAHKTFPDRYGSAPYPIKPLKSSGPPSTPLSIVIWSVLSAAWGKVFWKISADLSPSYKKVIQGADQEAAAVFKQKFLKSRKVGTVVFVLCVMDYLCTWTLRNRSFLAPEQRVLDYTNFFGDRFPYTTVMPLGQTLLMTLGSLWAVKTQRFVIIPLAAIGLYNHFDLLRGNALIDEVFTVQSVKQLLGLNFL